VNSASLSLLQIHFRLYETDHNKKQMPYSTAYLWFMRKTGPKILRQKDLWITMRIFQTEYFSLQLWTVVECSIPSDRPWSNNAERNERSSIIPNALTNIIIWIRIYAIIRYRMYFCFWWSDWPVELLPASDLMRCRTYWNAQVGDLVFVNAEDLQRQDTDTSWSNGHLDQLWNDKCPWY